MLLYGSSLSFHPSFIIYHKYHYLDRAKTQKQIPSQNKIECIIILFMLSCSGMDIFPTLLSLAGVTPPSDRSYDGIDVTNTLLHGEQTGHEVLAFVVNLTLVYINNFPCIVSVGVCIRVCCRH